eukprot:4609385-Amphidinium_carterae.1
MVLSASGKACAFELCEAFKAIKPVLEASGMHLNKNKCVVVTNTDACRLERRKNLAPDGSRCQLHHSQLGVDVQWGTLEKPGPAIKDQVLQSGHEES